MRQMQIDFNEEKHEYTVDGEKVPSVSEILFPLSAEQYGGINPIVLQEAARRGRIVHELCEAVDYGLDLEEDEEAMEFAPYVDAYYAFLIDHEVEWEMSERIVWMPRFAPQGSPDSDNVVYAGTVDRFGEVDGEMAVVDIKTYASLSTDSQMTTSCQTQLYKDAVFWTRGENTEWAYDSIKRFILHLKKDGKYRLVDLDSFDEARGWNSGAVARELTQLWWQKQAARNAGRKKKK